MENYKVIRRLGKGAQGSVFLVEDKQTGEKCVLKKVECNDESDANKAFKEAVALQQLKHPYICGYREFFVIWDQEVHAIFVCIVMHYYELGDLERALRQRRSKGIFLEKDVMYKWLGEMVEALHYVHEQKMIHRDLKPSNIFLKDDLSIAIGDFGVATVMGNIRTVTRTAVGSMSWMAPEILETTAHYDERTDVWSLGCILLEMATCGFMDQAQISGVLFQLKDNPQVLEDVLERVNKEYSPDLSQLVRTMLRRAFHQRPTMREMVELPLVQDCLKLSGSSLFKKSKCSGEECEVEPVPTEGGVDAIMAYMTVNAGSERSQLEALKQLNLITSSEGQEISDACKDRVLKTMSQFPSSVDVQINCCQVLSNVALTASEDDVLFTKKYITPICLAMRSHAGSAELQSSASSLIMALSSDESAAEILGEVGGVQDILAAMRSFPANLEVVSNGCTALWSLSVIESNMSIITKERGVQDICNALECHSGCSDLVDAACSALWSLSMEDDNLSIMADIGVVELLLKAMENHIKDPGVVKFGCAALSSLSEAHEMSAYYILQTENKMEGIPLLLKAMSLHADNGEVIESIALLFQELATYDEIRADLVSLKVNSALGDLRVKFPQNQATAEDEHEAGVALENAVAALEGKKVDAGQKRPLSSAARKRS